MSLWLSNSANHLLASVVTLCSWIITCFNSKARLIYIWSLWWSCLWNHISMHMFFSKFKISRSAHPLPENSECWWCNKTKTTGKETWIGNMIFKNHKKSFKIKSLAKFKNVGQILLATIHLNHIDKSLLVKLYLKVCLIWVYYYQRHGLKRIHVMI